MYEFIRLDLRIRVDLWSARGNFAAEKSFFHAFISYFLDNCQNYVLQIKSAMI